MRHLMLLGPTFRGRHAPGSSRRAFEHKARSRAGLAEGVIEITDRFRPVGILVAILRIAARLLDSDLLPVGVQFVGRHHGWGARCGCPYPSPSGAPRWSPCRSAQCPGTHWGTMVQPSSLLLRPSQALWWVALARRGPALQRKTRSRENCDD